MPTDEHFVQQATDCKLTGNAHVSKKEWKDAVVAYSNGLDFVGRISSSTSSTQLHATLLSNRAHCYVSTGQQYDRAVKDCSHALELLQKDNNHSNNTNKLRHKLWFRRSKARWMLSQLGNTTTNNGQNAQHQSQNELRQDAAKDLLQLLSDDPHNRAAQQLLTAIRAQHQQSTPAASPLAQVVQQIRELSSTTTSASSNNNSTELELPLKKLMALLEDDVRTTSMEMGRAGVVAVLQHICLHTYGSGTSKTPLWALQCLSRAASHPAFCRAYLVHEQAFCRTVLEKVSAVASTSLSEYKSELTVSALAILSRLILHLDRDDDAISEKTLLDYNVILQCCQLALLQDDNNDDILVVRAVLDVLSSWTCGTERWSRIRSSLLNGSSSTADPTVPAPVTPADMRAMTPRQLAAHRQRVAAVQSRDQAAQLERCRLWWLSTYSRTAYFQAATRTHSHVLRREMTVVLGRLLGALHERAPERAKEWIQPHLCERLTDNNDREPKIVEVLDDDDYKEDNDDENCLVSTETKMQHALITAALLLVDKEIGAWALGTAWRDAGAEIPALILTPNHPAAWNCASEVISGAATVESARSLVRDLIQSGTMQVLLQSPDRDIRSGAASAVAKLGLAEHTKNKHSDEGERMGLLAAACDLLEWENDDDPAAAAHNNNNNNNQDASNKNNNKKKKKTKQDLLESIPQHQFSSFAGSSVERGVEMLSYLVSNTDMKEEVASGFRGTGKQTVLERLVEICDMPGAGESLSAYALANTFQQLCVTNLKLRQESFEGREVTMEQYDELQKMGKTEEEKDLMDLEVDPDTPDACLARIRKVAAANVPRALVALTETNENTSEKTLEQVVMAWMRMADEVSVRGIMIQQGVLSKCIQLEKAQADDPAMTDLMKTIVRVARHVIAKLLITTNPALLTSAQRLGSIKPLVELVRDIQAKDLQHFEALMSLTNLASSGEDAQNRIVSERGISTFHYSMFTDHEMVQRAATEALCNLVPHAKMMEHLQNPDHLKLWLALGADYEDGYECARAATGCLAMATQQDEKIARALVGLERFDENMSSILESGRLEIMYRGMAVVLNLTLMNAETREKAMKLIAFCRAYVESYHSQEHPEDIEFSAEERALLPVTMDMAKKIVKAAEEEF